jgi:hypothetical protein
MRRERIDELIERYQEMAWDAETMGNKKKAKYYQQLSDYIDMNRYFYEDCPDATKSDILQDFALEQEDYLYDKSRDIDDDNNDEDYIRG